MTGGVLISSGMFEVPVSPHSKQIVGQTKVAQELVLDGTKVGNSDVPEICFTESLPAILLRYVYVSGVCAEFLRRL